MKRIQDPGEFGRALQASRKAFNLTQHEAAQLAGVTQRLWSECETGKRTHLGLDTAIRMIQTVGADLFIETRKDQQRSTRKI